MYARKPLARLTLILALVAPGVARAVDCDTNGIDDACDIAGLLTYAQSFL